MIDSVRGLPSVYNILSPAAYRAQENGSAENASTHLQQAQSESGGVKVTLSQEALALIRGDTQKKDNQQNQTGGTTTNPENAATGEAGTGQGKSAAGTAETGKGTGTTGETELTEEEQREVENLKSRDQEVRAHEQAHLSAAGNLATSGAHYEYENGPDGKRYAVGGEVNISLREGDTPSETIRNAQQAERAALAPANPSTQDRKVASEAAAMINEARQEELQQGSASAQGVLAAGEKKTTETNGQQGSQTEQNSLLAGIQKTTELIGRQAFAVQSQMERGYLTGMSFSAMSMQA